MKLFISYAKKDTRKLALALCDALNKIDGLSVWVDRSLRAGKAWELQIQQEIDTCDTMIVLYSPDINRHKNGEPESYMLTEIAYAKYTVNKPIIPVMAQKTTPPMALTMTHYIDYTLDGLTLDDLVEALCAELETEAKPAPITASPPTVKPKTPPPAPKATPKPTPKPTKPDYAAQIRAIIGDPFDLCEVPAGEFIYGDDNDEWADERQILTLPTFYIGKYPITISQYHAFIDHSNGYKDPRWWGGLDQRTAIIDQREIDNHPHKWARWHESIAFCRWLSWKLGGGYAQEDVASWLVRLPTEFEWEKAARGTKGLIYPYGNEFDKNKGNTKESGIGKTTPVMQYPQGASPYGVLDMSGNVWEWCLRASSNSQIDLTEENMSSNILPSLRGGSYLNDPQATVAATRGSVMWDSYGGFRIVVPRIS